MSEKVIKEQGTDNQTKVQGGEVITKYYSCTPIIKEVLCNNCGAILHYARSDFGRGKLAWLHTCDKCGKSYWLGNRYPCTDYIVDTCRALDIKTDPIESEEAK